MEFKETKIFINHYDFFNLRCVLIINIYEDLTYKQFTFQSHLFYQSIENRDTTIYDRFDFIKVPKELPQTKSQMDVDKYLKIIKEQNNTILGNHAFEILKKYYGIDPGWAELTGLEFFQFFMAEKILKEEILNKDKKSKNLIIMEEDKRKLLEIVPTIEIQKK